MRRLIAMLAATAMMLVALPAAAEEGCVDYQINHELTSPMLVGSADGYPGFRTAIVGHFLWIEFGPDEETRDSYDSENQSSVDVSDESIIGVTICAVDQSVALYTAPEETGSHVGEPADELAPAVAITIQEPASHDEPLVNWTAWVPTPE